MKEKIPLEVKKLYKSNSLSKRAYVNLRWRLCPFEKLEKYLPKSGVILDIGCGYGLLTNFLSFKSAQRQVIGIDNSQKRLEVAKSTIKERSNIKFIQGNVDNLELPVCNGAVMSDFLHHLPEKTYSRLLAKIYSKLEPGGKLIIEEVDNKPFWKYLSNLFIDHILYPGQKINFKPADYWRKLLTEIGFQVEIVSAHQELPLSDVIFVCAKE